MGEDMDVGLDEGLDAKAPLSLEARAERRVRTLGGQAGQRPQASPQASPDASAEWAGAATGGGPPGREEGGPVGAHPEPLMPRSTRTARANKVARVLIVDDHELARAGLRSMLSGTSWLEVIGEATDGTHALSVCRLLRPDLILMDVRMPGPNGIATTRAIKEEHPTTSVVIVTMYDNPEYLLEALKAGAAGYVLKDSTRAELLTTLKRVLNGDSILDGELAGRLLRRLASETPRETAQAAQQLTLREQEVLRLLAQGQTNREIASVLVVSVGTVKVHVEHIIAKLGVSDRTQAAVRAVALGLLDAKLA